MELSLLISIVILVISIVGSFLGGLFTRNYSHVDRLWSILPPVYVLVWMFRFSDNPRFLITALLIIVWGIRLTLNFARRGGYAFCWKNGFTGEDYRWEVLRSKIPNRFLFELFNLGFIATFQLTLIFLFTLPVYFIGTADIPLTARDAVLFLLFVLFLVLETIADNQQFAFHSHKERKKDDPVFALGFNTTGLWKYSRHPNYLCELGQWLVVWLLAVQATGTWHWTGCGILILLLLFIGSTIMTESITRRKYPKYAQWQQATPPWLPFFDMPLRRAARKRFWRDLYHA
jgi:steroid 5-alpha reductase family enzyme